MEIDLLGDTVPDTGQEQITEVAGGNKPVRPSIDDLLLLDDESASASQQSLAPALRPQNSSETKSLVQGNAAESEEFGDFLQGDSAQKIAADELKCKSGLSEKVNIEKVIGLKSPVDQTADQVLQWISTTNAGESSSNAGALRTQDAVRDAWDNASGLMGGSHMDEHIGEIASRLCSVIPANADNEQQSMWQSRDVFAEEEATNGEGDVPVAEETDAWRSLLAEDFLQPVGNDGTMARQPLSFEQHILDSVWPRDNVWSGDTDTEQQLDDTDTDTDTDGNLVNAYLKLAEVSKDAT
ncbi:hypothetical protein J3B02_003593 [Coemansia erecta]|uniref:Uncharacterized protein n=1 Tax=Coemansia asiatica TaxID=1052880 RepID=A0A9W8CL95_9FUNG|nr:hypothetical protein LPJ64_000037 [Coemansia asiatica]KAJ2851147.1 hypothetical protein J3B02_003593 [Coemansia erecta]KAJ2872748.1 hypothetical protein FB639_004303 [Coemansia asiatica]